ncbi:hypothetical protein HNO89_002412 [Sporosarcina luteola]|nr:hypothetical protein [Sporosarcina luteola]
MKSKHDDEIKALLMYKQIPPVDEEEKRELVHKLKAYMPVSQAAPSKIMQQLIQKAFTSIYRDHKIELFVLLTFLLLAYSFMPASDVWIVIMSTSPIPIFLAGWHLLNGQSNDMVELELTYKYTFHQVLFSKIIAIVAWNLGIYSVALLYLLGIKNMDISLYFFHIVILGLTPIITFSLALLLLSIKYRRETSWTVVILTWIFFVLLSLQTPLGTFLIEVNVLFYVLLNGSLVLFLLHRLQHLWRTERLSDGIL